MEEKSKDKEEEKINSLRLLWREEEKDDKLNREGRKSMEGRGGESG